MKKLIVVGLILVSCMGMLTLTGCNDTNPLGPTGQHPDQGK